MSTIIALASGKGGVGKTLCTASLAVSLQRQGFTVLAIDADMGLRNLDLTFGVQDSVFFDISDLIKQRCRREEALISVAEGLDFLAASQQHTWAKVDVPSFQYAVESLSESYDYTLLDCPPGRDRAYKNSVAIADRLFFIIEPTWASMRDASRVMQFCNKHKQFNYDVLFNNFYGNTRGFVTIDKMNDVLNPERIAGLLPHDDELHEAVQSGALLEVPAANPFFRAMEETAAYITQGRIPDLTYLKTLLPCDGEELAGDNAAITQEEIAEMNRIWALADAELKRVAENLPPAAVAAETETGKTSAEPENAGRLEAPDLGAATAPRRTAALRESRQEGERGGLSLRRRRSESRQWRHFRR